MEQQNRKNLRLKDYDYSQNGMYFITICTDNHQHLLGRVVVGNGLDRSAMVQYTSVGEIAKIELQNIEQHFPYISILKWVIMPNHIHVIVFVNRYCERERARPFPTVSTVIGLYKSGVSRKCGRPIWQKSFHDHIIRNDTEYLEIWQYIHTNPLKWDLDEYNTKLT